MKRHLSTLFLFLYLFTSFSLISIAQNPQIDSLEEEISRANLPDFDENAFSLTTPKRTIATHLSFLQEIKYKPDSAALALKGSITRDLGELAIKLKQIYDGEAYYIYFEELPDDPNYKDSLGRHRYVVFPKYPEIFVEKIGNEWKYSQKTVDLILPIHSKVFPFGTDFLIDLVPQVGHNKVLGLQLWQWVGILILMIIAFVVYKIFDLVFSFMIKRVIPVIAPRAQAIDPKLIHAVARPLSFLLVTLLFQSFFPILQLPISLGRYITVALKITSSVFGVLTVYKLVDLLADISGKLANRTDTALDDQLIPLVRKITKLIVGVLGIIFILQNLDVNVTALLAGVSIGGLALALAAQDTVKNFIGSISIFVDQPFQMGDFIETPKVTGSVVEVGVRSTRVREPGGAIVSIPNGDLANLTVTNHRLRTYRRYSTTLGITYGTPVASIQAFVEGMRQIVADHPKTRETGNMIYFHEMADSSLNIFFMVYFEITAYDEWLEAKQEILFEVMKLAESLKISFAFPSTSVYVESMPKERGEVRGEK